MWAEGWPRSWGRASSNQNRSGSCETRCMMAGCCDLLARATVCEVCAPDHHVQLICPFIKRVSATVLLNVHCTQLLESIVLKHRCNPKEPLAKRGRMGCCYYHSRQPQQLLAGFASQLWCLSSGWLSVLDVRICGAWWPAHVA